MMKLTKAEVSDRLKAALAILGEEECEEKQADQRIKWARSMLENAVREPVTAANNVANDRTII
jgi:hypothetical protein